MQKNTTLVMNAPEYIDDTTRSCITQLIYNFQKHNELLTFLDKEQGKENKTEQRIDYGTH